jgi:hypothetical protein
MGGAAQVAMSVASQIWQVVFASQTLQVFCLALRKKAQYVVVQEDFPNILILDFTTQLLATLPRIIQYELFYNIIMGDYHWESSLNKVTNSQT